MEIALGLAGSQECTIHLAYVYEVPRAFPLDYDNGEDLHRGEILLEAAGDMAARRGIQVEMEFLQARASGPAILDASRDLGVDTIILGMRTPSELDTRVLTLTESYVLKKADCRLIFIRKPRGESC
jgi:nucleotide-binding universal stress UspA family protein